MKNREDNQIMQKEGTGKKGQIEEIDLDDAEQVSGGTMRNQVVFTDRVTLDEIKH